MKQNLIIIMMVACASMAYGATENVTYYANGNFYETTTCSSGGDVLVPATEPNIPGYTFGGWRVETYDFSTLNATDNGTNYWAKGRDTSNGNDVCYANSTTASTCSSAQSDLMQYQWKTTFSWGLIYGDALCSSTLGTYAVAGTPDTTTNNGQYCWCRATGYKPSNGDIVYSRPSAPAWVFRYDHGSPSHCASHCALYCAGYVQSTAGFRRPVFGVTQ